MEIYRTIYNELEKWKKNSSKKPMILRGARQVGKSYIAKTFSKTYSQKILLNLEKTEEAALFEKYQLEDLIDFLYSKNKYKKNTECFLFIDEIQESPKALQMLRFFYEEHSYLHVMAAGSLLEFALDKIESFPVGRVQQIAVYPVSFEEYLHTVNPELIPYYQEIPCSNVGHDLLMPIFHQYTLLGGMPELLKTYLISKDLVSSEKIYADLWQGYKDDSEKYAKNPTDRKVLRHILNYGQFEQDRIKYECFANSNYKSREVSEAFQSLEMAKIIQLIHPITSTHFPPIPNLKRSPRMQYIDTGILNYLLGIQADMIGIKDLSDFMRGKIVQHIVSQEMISSKMQFNYKPFFWVREQLNANAEIDLILNYKNKIYPIEIKSGTKGRLRSLMQFMDESTLDIGIRLSANYFSKEEAKTIKQKEFTLLNIPYFHAAKLELYVELGGYGL
jgi:predicted AAA+ superfamily ATPase